MFSAIQLIVTRKTKSVINRKNCICTQKYIVKPKLACCDHKATTRLIFFLQNILVYFCSHRQMVQQPTQYNYLNTMDKNVPVKESTIQKLTCKPATD